MFLAFESSLKFSMFLKKHGSEHALFIQYFHLTSRGVTVKHKILSESNDTAFHLTFFIGVIHTSNRMD